MATSIARSLKAHQTEFIRLVHPDYFAAMPTQQAVNEASLKLLLEVFPLAHKERIQEEELACFPMRLWFYTRKDAVIKPVEQVIDIRRDEHNAWALMLSLLCLYSKAGLSVDRSLAQQVLRKLASKMPGTADSHDVSAMINAHLAVGQSLSNGTRQHMEAAMLLARRPYILFSPELSQQKAQAIANLLLLEECQSMLSKLESTFGAGLPLIVLGQRATSIVAGKIDMHIDTSADEFCRIIADYCRCSSVNKE